MALAQDESLQLTLHSVDEPYFRLCLILLYIWTVYERVQLQVTMKYCR